MAWRLAWRITLLPASDWAHSIDRETCQPPHEPEIISFCFRSPKKSTSTWLTVSPSCPPVWYIEHAALRSPFGRLLLLKTFSVVETWEAFLFLALRRAKPETNDLQPEGG